MQWMDAAACMAAERHAKRPSVTACMDDLTFGDGIGINQLVVVRAMVNAAFGKSMEVGVLVTSEDPLTGIEAHCCSAFFTFVALDENGELSYMTVGSPPNSDCTVGNTSSV